MTRVNLFSKFEETVQHYRPVIDGLAKTYETYETYESYENIRELAIQLLLMSRVAEISIRRVNDRVLTNNNLYSSKNLLTILDTLAAMDLYRDLLTRLFDEYKDMFQLTLQYEGMYTTPMECMVHAQNIEAESEGWCDTQNTLRLELIQSVCEICESCGSHIQEPGELPKMSDLSKVWHKHLVVWRYLIQSRQAAIGMMRNQLVYNV